MQPLETILIEDDPIHSSFSNKIEAIESLSPEEEAYIAQFDHPVYSSKYKKRKLTQIEKLKGQQIAHSPYEKSFFSFQNSIKEELLSLIAHEKKTILLTMYTFTDEDIAQELIDAHKKGVEIEVIFDGEQTCALFDMYKIAIRLKNNGIGIWLFPNSRLLSNHIGIMHNKFILFGNQNNGPLLWTGSFNFTKSANKRNAENVILLNSPTLIHAYQNQFEKLKAMSIKSLPSLSSISCPKCKDNNLRLNQRFFNIRCDSCDFKHQYIQK